MPKIMAMMLAGGRVDELSVLTQYRPKSAVPFGGLYRVIDFPLSNLMNSGIENVGVLSQYRSFSLINHLGNGASWDLVGRNRSLTILPPFKDHADSGWYRGNADAVFQNLEFLLSFRPEHVLVLSADHVYRMDYQPLLKYHLEKDADLTMAFIEAQREQAARFGLAVIDDEDGHFGGRILDYVEKPAAPASQWASMTVYLFKAEVLYDVLIRNNQRGRGFEFGHDIIPSMLSGYRLYGYKHASYWGYTRTIDEYWQTSMDMLGENPPINPEIWKVRTNLAHNATRDHPPAILGPAAEVTNSLIYNGCRIHGKVTNSILFPGVTVGAGAEINGSILMFNTQVGEKARLERVISDVETTIGRGVEIGIEGEPVPNRESPHLLSSGITLIGRSCDIPSGIRVGKNCIIKPDLSYSKFKDEMIPSGTTVS